MSGPEASSPLQGRREGRIEIVTLNRPAQRNAMSAALVDELIAVFSLGQLHGRSFGAPFAEDSN